ncbi:MAG: formate dehydrogenase subunit delta [Planctomycetes bacterium]|nr:formate dehydrogenase subunit delta [Planctomycetota bacterium]
MDAGKLTRMANQIAEFFAAEPDAKVGVAGVVNHIQKFWEPRMRKAILAAFDAGQTEAMHPLVVAALAEHRQQLEPVGR